jgi:hypothetical protein
VLAILFGLIYFFKFRPNKKINPDNNTTPTNTTVSAITDIPLVPTNTANENSTVAAVVV